MRVSLVCFAAHAMKNVAHQNMLHDFELRIMYEVGLKPEHHALYCADVVSPKGTFSILEMCSRMQS